jgi:hypothetical protein
MAICFAVALAVTGCSGSSDPGGTAAAGATTAGSSTAAVTGKASAPAGSEPPVATGTPSVAISRAPVVKIGKVAEISDNVRVDVGRVRELTVKAENPGEIKGDAAAVQVTVRNTSSRPFSLDGMVVTASYHNGLPGDETSSGPSDPLTGSLAVGKKATGTYVFMVPRKYASGLHLEVSSNQSPTIVRFAR